MKVKAVAKKGRSVAHSRPNCSIAQAQATQQFNQRLSQSSNIALTVQDGADGPSNLQREFFPQHAFSSNHRLQQQQEAASFQNLQSQSVRPDNQQNQAVATVSNRSHHPDVSLLAVEPQPNTEPRQAAYFSTQHYEAVGILQAIWRNSRNQTAVVNYGTAFLVSPHLLLTCQHNLFHEPEHAPATQITFLPGVHSPITPSTASHSARPRQFYRAKEIVRGEETFSIRPTINELCLVALQSPVWASSYARVGSLQLERGQEVELIGYPSQAYSKALSLAQIVPCRTHLKGRLVHAKEHSVSYAIDTKVGHSGSPLFALNPNNQPVVIGIHTHRGFAPLVNCGLLLSREAQRLLLSYQRELKKEHGLPDEIAYVSTKADGQLGCVMLSNSQEQQPSVMGEFWRDSTETASLMERVSSNDSHRLSKTLSHVQEQEAQQFAEVHFSALGQSFVVKTSPLTGQKYSSSSESLDDFQRFYEQIRASYCYVSPLRTDGQSLQLAERVGLQHA